MAIDGIDHVGLVAHDLPPLAAAMRRLGFHVTEPRPLMGRDAQGRARPLGQASQHIVLRRGYVELTAITDPAAHNHLEPYIARYPGLHILALATRDARASWEELAGRGVATPAPAAAAREIAYGSRHGIAGFAWFMVPPDEAPEALACVVEHETPELVYQPEVQVHANGATALVGMTLCVADVAATCDRYERWLGRAADAAPGGRSFALGGERLWLTDPDGLASQHPGVAPPVLPWAAGLTIAVEDPAAARRMIEAAGVATAAAAGDGFWVAPDAAGGAVLAFQPAP